MINDKKIIKKIDSIISDNHGSEMEFRFAIVKSSLPKKFDVYQVEKMLQHSLSRSSKPEEIEFRNSLIKLTEQFSNDRTISYAGFVLDTLGPSR